MKKPMHRLIRGLVFLLAASLPRTSDAGSVYGTWRGMFTETIEEIENGVVSGPDTTVFPGTLTMQWTDSPPGGSVEFNISLYVAFYPTFILTDPFGPQSASFGGDVSNGGLANFTQEFNLTASYSSMGPDGVIVGGSATADFTYVGVTNLDPSDFSTISIVESFQGTTNVPEPPAIVSMGLGLLTGLIFARLLGVPIRPFRALPRRAEYR